VKERRGPLGRTVGAVAQGLAGAARRRQADREPRVVLYDAAGHATRLHSGTPEHDALVEIADRLVEAGGPTAALEPEQP
jgi:hypothetical protein